MPRAGHAWFALIIGLVFTLLGGVPLIFGLWSYTWNQADGVVTYSKPYNYARWYEVDLRYKYTYQGREYSGDTYRYRFVMDRLESSEVDRVQARYPVGEKVRVAVNPWQPAQSVLEAGVEWNDFVWPPIGIFFLVFAFRIDRRRAPAEKTAIKRRFSTATVLCVIGAGLVLYGVNTLATAWRSSQWPVIDGKVFHSVARGAPGGHEVQLWYEYHVQGTRYVSDGYRVGGNISSFEQVAREAVARYPAGRVVKVYYNPGNPGDAILQPGVWYGNFVLPGVGIVLLICAWVAKKLAAAMRH